MRTLPRKRRSQRGFALLTVILLLAVVSAVVATSLEESADTIRAAGIARRAETVRTGLEHGMHLGMAHVRTLDAGTLVDPANDWDIFNGGAGDFVGPVLYPPAGPEAGRFEVRVGLRPTQRGRAPAGEDVRTSYGQIVEMQVAVHEATHLENQKRVSVGVLIPRRQSHAQ